MFDVLTSRSRDARFASVCLRPPLRGQFFPLVAHLIGPSSGCHLHADVSIRVEQFERHAALPRPAAPIKHRPFATIKRVDQTRDFCALLSCRARSQYPKQKLGDFQCSQTLAPLRFSFGSGYVPSSGSCQSVLRTGGSPTILTALLRHAPS